MSQPDADVKNSDTLWRYRKKFRFLKEAKFLSEILHSKLACPMPIYVSGWRTPGIPSTETVKSLPVKFIDKMAEGDTMGSLRGEA